MRIFRCLWLMLLCALAACLPVGGALHAQDDEYQVNQYRAGTLPAGVSRITLHTNYFFDGTVGVNNTPFTKAGTYGNDRDVHETLEMTQGLKSWMQVTLYTFSSIDGERGLQWAGNHIKPTFSAPERLHLPFRASVGVQGGYQRARFSQDTWRIEVRPAVERRFGRYDVSFSPLFLKAIHGPGVENGFTFAANLRASARLSRLLNASVLILRINEPQMQIFPLVTFHLKRGWDLSTGVGIRPAQSTDPYIPRLLIGRRFRLFGQRKAAPEGVAGSAGSASLFR